MMHHVPQPGLTLPAVAGRLERGVRHQRGDLVLHLVRVHDKPGMRTYLVV
jgi:hypothetical protein